MLLLRGMAGRLKQVKIFIYFFYRRPAFYDLNKLGWIVTLSWMVNLGKDFNDCVWKSTLFFRIVWP